MTPELAAMAGIGLAIFLAAIGAAVGFGRLTQRVAQVEAGLVEVKTEVREENASLRAEVREEIASLRAEVREEIASLRAEVREEIGSLRAEMRDLRTEMQQGFAEMRAEMAEFRVQMVKMQGQIEHNNLMLMGLAQHRHDTDGRVLFTWPEA